MPACVYLCVINTHRRVLDEALAEHLCGASYCWPWNSEVTLARSRSLGVSPSRQGGQGLSRLQSCVGRAAREAKAQMREMLCEQLPADRVAGAWERRGVPGAGLDERWGREWLVLRPDVSCDCCGSREALTWICGVCSATDRCVTADRLPHLSEPQLSFWAVEKVK